MEISFAMSIGLKWNIENINTNKSIFSGTDKVLLHNINIVDGDYRFILTNTNLVKIMHNYNVIINNIIEITKFPSDGIYSIINLKNGIVTDKIFSYKKLVCVQGNVLVETEMNINKNYDIIVEPLGSLCMGDLSNINLNHDHSRIIVNGELKCDGETTININKNGLLKAHNNITENNYASHGVILKDASILCDIMKINIKKSGQVSVNGNTNTNNSLVEINLTNADPCNTGLIIADDGMLSTSSISIQM